MSVTRKFKGHIYTVKYTGQTAKTKARYGYDFNGYEIDEPSIQYNLLGLYDSEGIKKYDFDKSGLICFKGKNGQKHSLFLDGLTITEMSELNETLIEQSTNE